jgi:hypothetical protein
VGSIRSFHRSAEGTVDLGAPGQCDGMALHHKVGIAVRLTASRSVWDRCVKAGFDALPACWLTNHAPGHVFSLLPIPSRI